MRPQPTDRALIEEGHREWSNERIADGFAQDIAEAGGSMIWAKHHGFDFDFDFYNWQTKELLKEKSKWVRAAHYDQYPEQPWDDIARWCDVDDGLGWSEDQQLAAAIEAVLWPSIPVLA